MTPIRSSSYMTSCQLSPCFRMCCTSESPGNLQKLEIPSAHFRASNSEFIEVEPNVCIFNNLFR